MNSELNAIKKLVVIFLIGFVVLFFVFALHTPTPDAPKTVAQIADDKNGTDNGALQLCHNWTDKNAKLGVGETVKEYYVVDKTKRRPRSEHVVVMEWRAQGSGLLMYSQCDVLYHGDTYFMKSAKSGMKE